MCGVLGMMKTIFIYTMIVSKYDIEYEFHTL